MTFFSVSNDYKDTCKFFCLYRQFTVYLCTWVRYENVCVLRAWANTNLNPGVLMINNVFGTEFIFNYFFEFEWLACFGTYILSAVECLTYILCLFWIYIIRCSCTSYYTNFTGKIKDMFFHTFPYTKMHAYFMQNQCQILSFGHYSCTFSKILVPCLPPVSIYYMCMIT